MLKPLGVVLLPVRGWEGDSTPAGGTGGVRPGGRGDRRRSGGNADHADRRSRRGLSRETGRLGPAAVGGRRETSGDRSHGGCSHPAGAGELPNRERCRNAGFPGGSKGGGATLARASVFNTAWAGLRPVTVVSQRATRPRPRPGRGSMGGLTQHRAAHVPPVVQFSPPSRCCRILAKGGSRC